MIELSRAYLPDGSATLGIWTVEGAKFHVLEPPWRGNKPFKSCIPEGVYTLRLRNSEVVERTSRGRFTQGWEITDVIERTLITAHVGNYASHTEGCPLIGDGFAWDSFHGPMVTNSERTFRDFMRVMSAQDEWDIHIRGNFPEYP